MFNLDSIIRTNIKNLQPYSSARDEFSGSASVFLDANENPFNAPFNRYPDPYQSVLKEKISSLKNIPTKNIFLGNGSDEPIDLLFRVFCEPGIDNVISISPSYGMYAVCADVNNIKLKKVLLTNHFQLDADAVLDAVDANTKLIFLCSPNNPSGNLLDKSAMLKIVSNFNGLVVVDEAYIDFAPEATLLNELYRYPNLVVLQTFSKAWGMAGLRLGMAFVSSEILMLLNKVKYPYNINILTQQKALELLDNKQEYDAWMDEILSERVRLIDAFNKMDKVDYVYPTDANFILIKMAGASKIYQKLVDKGIIVRDRSKVVLCNDCLRITVGAKEENDSLLRELNNM